METPPTKQTVNVPTLDVNWVQSFPLVLSGKIKYYAMKTTNMLVYSFVSFQ